MVGYIALVSALTNNSFCQVVHF